MKVYNNHVGNTLVDTIMIVADFGGHSVEEVMVSKDELNSKEWKLKSLTGKTPLFETSEGTLFETTAICKYLARLNP